MLRDKIKRNEAIVCIVGLGFVGLPLAIEFSKSLKVIGFDIDDEKIKELNNNSHPNILFTNDPKEINKADFVIIAVPTPVTKSKKALIFSLIGFIRGEILSKYKNTLRRWGLFEYRFNNTQVQ